ncbi:MAG: saccharopine dehydrogenase NADP-binding domain-containing protein [Alphaproteobacteria bacterium]
MRVAVIGCGFHGRGIAYELATADGVSSLIVIDRERERAERCAAKARAEAAILDIHDSPALDRALQGCALIVNAVGPYHYLDNALAIVEAALRARAHYADMADDHDVAEALFLDPVWDQRAKAAGIGVLTGCGIAPGLTGVLAKLGASRLDRPERVATRFSWNYSIDYPAALHHFLRINSGAAPQFIGGEFVRPGAFAGPETVRFLDPVGERTVVYTGINDPVSISRSIPGLVEVTAKGAFHQKEANDFVQSMVRWGWTNYAPVEGLPRTPFEMLMAYLRSPEGRKRFDIPPEPIPMAARVSISGLRGGKTATLHFEAQDFSRRASTTTTAKAALALAKGALEFTGVRAPEGALDPLPYLRDLLAGPDIKIFEWEAGGTPRPLAI